MASRWHPGVKPIYNLPFQFGTMNFGDRSNGAGDRTAFNPPPLPARPPVK